MSNSVMSPLLPTLYEHCLSNLGGLNSVERKNWFPRIAQLLC